MNRRSVLSTAAAAIIAVAGLGQAAKAQTMDIVETAAGAGSFTTLLAAAEAAGLVGTLKNTGPLTVFAPTDDAFAALPEGTVETLLMPENKDQLVAILSYHVVPAAIPSSEIAGRRLGVLTVEGSRLSVNGRGSGVRVNNARVISADIAASNGIIHVIDAVLIPEG